MNIGQLTMAQGGGNELTDKISAQHYVLNTSNNFCSLRKYMEATQYRFSATSHVGGNSYMLTLHITNYIS